MAGLPKLPGYNFTDPTITRYHLPHSFDFVNGYKIPKHAGPGIGGKPLDINSVGYVDKVDAVRFDPSLTYGRTRSKALPLFLPHFAQYDQKCLTFRAFFKQSVAESPDEHYRVRQVNIIYFLEDDTITVMEPTVENSGLVQGRMIRRSKIPKFGSGNFWHWKDLDVGKDICFYGIVFHTVDCDTFTKEYMASQGLVMGDTEQMPPDPYTQKRLIEHQMNTSRTPTADDKLRRFLEYDGKILKFKALWDDRDSEYGDIRPYIILYFLADDTVSVKEVHDRNDGRDPFPQLLRKTKLPKVWTDMPVTFPSIYLERSDDEVTEYYQPKDFLIGDTVFVLGRRMFLYDCDDFTRHYFRKVLCIEQKPTISIKKEKKPIPERPMPPYDGLGSLEDSLQNTLTFMPKAPRKDVLRQVLNANKYLRYEMKLDVVHPEDAIRRFLLNYGLGDGMCTIYEPPVRNSGIVGGKYLRSSLLSKPGCNPLDPVYYTPVDFYIGAVITVFEQRFVITGADLYVYRYMQANPEKFPCEVIENIRNYMFNQGLLNEDIDDRVEEDMEREKKERRDAIGKEIKVELTDMDKCMAELKVGGEHFDPAYEEQKKKEIVDQYEASLQHRYAVPSHGIQPVEKTCAYPVHVGDVKSTECGALEGNYELAPKHIDTPEEIQQKYYDSVLRRHKDICEDPKPIECDEAPKLGDEVPDECKVEKIEPKPIMVHPVELPEDACRVKTVKFVEGQDRCFRDRYDLCDLNTEKTQCDCTDYKKC